MGPGDLFADRYELEHLLGRGAMGEVWRARDRVLGEVVALKVLLTEQASTAAVERFLREVRLARRVTHPNVARVHDVGSAEGRWYLTMECVVGRTLRDLLGAGPIAPAETLRIATALCAGLRAAHDAGIVHRDLKPTNVLADDDGRVVITDFGVSRALTEASELTGGVVGTPRYMSPEQALGRDVDARTDVYAFGLMLFEMLTGSLPSELTKPERDTGEATSLRDALVALACLCARADPDARPASMADVARRLRVEPAAADAPRTDFTPPLPTDAPRAPLPDGPEPALAVLPMRYRGEPAGSHVADVLTDELIDLLSTTRGLRVLASGATSRFRDERDPRAVTAALGVTAVVDGSVQKDGGRVTISVRLADGATGIQRYAERFEGAVDCTLSFRDAIAHRIAEALRCELSLHGNRADPPSEAMDLYLLARARLRAVRITGPEGARDLLERCIALAPDFAPGLSAHAFAMARGLFFASCDDTQLNATLARASVDRALARAPRLAESHLAEGLLSVQLVEYARAAAALAAALRIAPTLAEAHYMLGMLQSEVGLYEEGVRRMRLAVQIDPSHDFAIGQLATRLALTGDARADEVIAQLAQRPAAELVVQMYRVRRALWNGDHAALAELDLALGEQSNEVRTLFQTIVAAALGRPFASSEEEFVERAQSARRQTMLRQLLVEAHCAAGRHERALLQLESAAESHLVDAVWLDRCTAMAALRTSPRFARARALVRTRAHAVFPPV